MRFLSMIGILLFIGAISCLALLKRPRRAEALYVRVEEDAQNIEWLFTELLRRAGRRQLLVIDHSRGENRRILLALTRRYRIGFVEQAPPGAPLLFMRRDTTAASLLAQYAALEKQRERQSGA